MVEKYRFICPFSSLNTAERIREIIREFDEWISDPLLAELADKYGGFQEQLHCKDFRSRLQYLYDFASVWDYRKKQTAAITKEGEAARWLLKDDEVSVGNTGIIYSTADRLGLSGIYDSVLSEPAFILSLGGANHANISRTLRTLDLLKRIQAKGPDHLPVIVGLGCSRALSDDERKKISDYAPEANTEFDAMSTAIEKVYGAALLDETTEHDADPNKVSIVRKYQSWEFPGLQLYSLCAPSSDPDRRRADTGDTLDFLIRTFRIQPEQKIINITSPIYVPQQQIKSLDYAVKNHLEFDTIGFSQTDIARPEPIKYLQEIKATIDAMEQFLQNNQIENKEIS
ncbi:MAG: hypothetical protein IKF51_07415 [Solobacterium sp.]|nr:hypothetical protein [Solobacterium sp.]